MLRLCSLFALLLAGPALAADLAGPVRVIDGDTLAVLTPGGEAVVRLHGIDAPETAQACRTVSGARRDCGADATRALLRAIDGRAVRCAPLDMDRHERIVARCSVGGRDLGELLVSEGAAFAYARYSEDYLPAEAEARAARRGIWSGSAEPPEAWRLARRPEPPPPPSETCVIKGNISAHGRLYHLPGGRFYDRTGIDAARGERWFCSEDEARAAGWRAAQG